MTAPKSNAFEWAAPAVLGISACAACCAAPLIGLAVGAGAASTVATLAEPMAAVMLGAATLAGGFVLIRQRRASAEACATKGACATDCACSPGLDARKDAASEAVPPHA